MDELLHLPLDEMYKQRTNFVIVALVGTTGSGCTYFAEVMSKPFNEWNNVRTVSSLFKNKDEVLNKSQEVFIREYATCYKFCKNNSSKFKFQIIKYKDVVLFHALMHVFENSSNKNEFVNEFEEIIRINYVSNGYTTKYDITTLLKNKELHVIMDDMWNILNEKCKDYNNKNYSAISSLYYELKDKKLFDRFYNILKSEDYSLKNYFVHNISGAIRATGNPKESFENVKCTSDSRNLFDIVDTIKKIIKGFHENRPDEARLFVIDSIRNSLELLYLRERYNSFYSIAIHNEGFERALINKKLKNYYKCKSIVMDISKMVDNIISLNKTEIKKDDFEQGKFFAQDISRCISECELHISYLNEKPRATDDIKNRCSFYSCEEQWMKYASLIMRPGLITPTTDERNMAIAYVSKFNSGCISRQVGCAIVDKENSVQSIGWNDPPASQVPCNLRYIDELVNNTNQTPKKFRVYSKFELDEASCPLTDGKSFIEHMRRDSNEIVVMSRYLDNIGLSHSYCFRSKLKCFSKKDDNVNTRSLHAEENAMLRGARNGGLGLKGGTMYVTASPCVLCSKKACQIGIEDIVFIDPYTDIANDLVLNNGFVRPNLRQFIGAIGSTYYKLYQPFLPYKDELLIYRRILCK